MIWAAASDYVKYDRAKAGQHEGHDVIKGPARFQEQH